MISDSALPASLFATSMKDSRTVMETASPSGDSNKRAVQHAYIFCVPCKSPSQRESLTLEVEQRHRQTALRDCIVEVVGRELADRLLVQRCGSFFKLCSCNFVIQLMSFTNKQRQKTEIGNYFFLFYSPQTLCSAFQNRELISP